MKNKAVFLLCVITCMAQGAAKDKEIHIINNLGKTLYIKITDTVNRSYPFKSLGGQEIHEQTGIFEFPPDTSVKVLYDAGKQSALRLHIWPAAFYHFRGKSKSELYGYTPYILKEDNVYIFTHKSWRCKIAQALKRFHTYKPRYTLLKKERQNYADQIALLYVTAQDIDTLKTDLSNTMTKLNLLSDQAADRPLRFETTQEFTEYIPPKPTESPYTHEINTDIMQAVFGNDL